MSEPPPPTTPYYIVEVDETGATTSGNLGGSTDQGQAVELMLYVISRSGQTPRHLAVLQEATQAIVAFVRVG